MLVFILRFCRQLIEKVRMDFFDKLSASSGLAGGGALRITIAFIAFLFRLSDCAAIYRNGSAADQ